MSMYFYLGALSSLIEKCKAINEADAVSGMIKSDMRQDTHSRADASAILKVSHLPMKQNQQTADIKGFASRWK